MIFLNVCLHQSFTTTSSKRKARIGSLDTAFSSIQTSETSDVFVKVTTGKILENWKADKM